MKKRIIALCLTAILLPGLFSACSETPEKAEETPTQQTANPEAIAIEDETESPSRSFSRLGMRRRGLPAEKLFKIFIFSAKFHENTRFSRWGGGENRDFRYFRCSESMKNNVLLYMQHNMAEKNEKTASFLPSPIT